MSVKNEFDEYVEKCPKVKTIVQWYDLYEGHYVTLDKEFQRQLFQKAVHKAGNFTELGKIIRICRKSMSGCYYCKRRPSIRTLKKIVNYLGWSPNKLNSKIIEIAGLKPKLPFNLHNKEGAEIRAAFLSDGHVDKSPTGQCQYCAYETELHESLIRSCKLIFGEFKSKNFFCSRTHVSKFPAVIGKALELSGVPRGDKGFSNCTLPKDILLADKEIQSSYLRRIFDDEGDVCYDIHGKRAVRISRSINFYNLESGIPLERWTRFKLSENIKHNLLRGEQLLLIKLGIDARLYPEGVYINKNKNTTAKWRIQIGQQDQLRRFAELINFSLDKKREKLNNVLSSYQYRKLPNGKGKEEALEFIKKVYKNKGFFRFDDLGKEMLRTGRSYDLAGRYLKFFLDNNIIKKIKRGAYIFDSS